jgi:hypothetical protein
MVDQIADKQRDLLAERVRTATAGNAIVTRPEELRDDQLRREGAPSLDTSSGKST